LFLPIVRIITTIIITLSSKDAVAYERPYHGINCCGFLLSFQQFAFQIERRRAIYLEIKNIGKYKSKLPRISGKIEPLLAALGIREEVINKRSFSKKRGKDEIK